jgi:hypothetical protein
MTISKPTSTPKKPKFAQRAFAFCMTGFRFAGAGVNFTVGILVRSMETLGTRWVASPRFSVCGIGLHQKRCFGAAARS